MMKSIVLIGVILMSLGAAGLFYKSFRYESNETIAKVGPIEASAETTKEVPIPKGLSIISIIAGACLLIVNSEN